MFRENFEPDVYRDNLAEELSEASKENRKEILDEAKQTPEYQVARNKKIEGEQNEEEINNGEGVFVKKKTLYHGTSAKGIEKFEKAEEITVGEGVYLTSQVKDAINYARVRAENARGSKKNQADGNPIIYETCIENLKLLDLRDNRNFKNIMKGFFYALRERENSSEFAGPEYSWYRNELADKREIIGSGKMRGIDDIQMVTRADSNIFSDYVRSLGYDGLITTEGGEGEYAHQNHDSYVIFDPEKVKILKEQKIKKEQK